MLITVFTPTYNRAYRIHDLYESLKRQTLKDFEWLIVDDGSSDNTKELISEWIKEGEITIRYFYQENGGKHRAINKGVSMAKGELFFIVDSDDYLTSNALERIVFYYKQIIGNDEFAGVTGLRVSPEGNPYKLKKKFDVIDCTNLDIEKYISGDTAETYITDILRQYPFPEYDGEKFISEGVVWKRIAQKYKLRYFFEGIYVCEYLSDGLTANIRKKFRESPRGRMLSCKEGFIFEKFYFNKVKCAINYWNARIGYKFNIEKDLKLPLLGTIFYPLGLLIYIHDKWKSR